VAWDKETVVRAAETVGAAGTLWVLFLAQNDEVGIEKTSNLQTLDSSVRSYAKEIGLDDPGQETINQGYNRITNSRVVDADGNVACINRDDKSNDLVRLTPAGQDLVTSVHNDERIKNRLKEFLGLEVEGVQEPWWPNTDPSNLHVLNIRTFANHSVLDQDEAEITAIVSFDCPKCDSDVETEFVVRLSEGHLVEWGRTEEVNCSACDTSAEICPIDPHRPPEISL